MTNKELIRDLNSKNNTVINKALDFVSENGNPTIIPELINLLAENKNQEIKDKIISIFENLHDQNSLPYLVTALSEKKHISIRAILVATCWKNNINFDNSIELFTDLFIDGDFSEAFDAFTVIDAMQLVADDSAAICINKLKNYYEKADELKKSIIGELIKIIQNHRKNPAK
ncbi:MAG: hypothetical protein AB7S50_04205 [Bacteroidales bacterium]